MSSERKHVARLMVSASAVCWAVRPCFLLPQLMGKDLPSSSPGLQEEAARALGGHDVAGEVGVWPRDGHHLVDVTGGEGSLQGEVLRLRQVGVDAMKPPI